MNLLIRPGEIEPFDRGPAGAAALVKLGRLRLRKWADLVHEALRVIHQLVSVDLACNLAGVHGSIAYSRDLGR